MKLSNSNIFNILIFDFLISSLIFVFQCIIECLLLLIITNFQGYSYGDVFEQFFYYMGLKLVWGLHILYFIIFTITSIIKTIETEKGKSKDYAIIYLIAILPVSILMMIRFGFNEMLEITMILSVLSFVFIIILICNKFILEKKYRTILVSALTFFIIIISIIYSNKGDAESPKNFNDDIERIEGMMEKHPRKDNLPQH